MVKCCQMDFFATSFYGGETVLQLGSTHIWVLDHFVIWIKIQWAVQEWVNIEWPQPSQVDRLSNYFMNIYVGVNLPVISE